MAKGWTLPKVSASMTDMERFWLARCRQIERDLMIFRKRGQGTSVATLNRQFTKACEELQAHTMRRLAEEEKRATPEQALEQIVAIVGALPPAARARLLERLRGLP